MAIFVDPFGIIESPMGVATGKGFNKILGLKSISVATLGVIKDDVGPISSNA